MLRSYQNDIIENLYKYLIEKSNKNPCLELPTGAGKSFLIAKIIYDYVMENITGMCNNNLVVITHSKELIKQNIEKLHSYFEYYNNEIIPYGIYSASFNEKDDSQKVTFSSIQSISRNKNIKKYDIIIVDEAHQINTTENGQYRKFIKKCLQENPDCITIGLTATPYRLDQGLLTYGREALFDDIIRLESCSVLNLIDNNWLADIKSKGRDIEIDFNNTSKSGFDFDAKEVNDIINVKDLNETICDDILTYSSNKKHVMIFCSNIAHSKCVSDILKNKGKKSVEIHHKLSSRDRDAAINGFKAAEYQFICNTNILTIGFDFHNIDCIILLRPTLSTSMYVQMIGRGARLKDHTNHCLIVDYVGNIRRHGLFTDTIQLDHYIKPKISVKKCLYCGEFNFLSISYCIECGKSLFEKVDNQSRLYQAKSLDQKNHNPSIIMSLISNESDLDENIITIIIEGKNTQLKIALIHSSIPLKEVYIVELLKDLNYRVRASLILSKREIPDHFLPILAKDTHAQVRISLIISKRNITSSIITCLSCDNDINVLTALVSSEINLLPSDKEIISKQNETLKKIINGKSKNFQATSLSADNFIEINIFKKIISGEEFLNDQIDNVLNSNNYTLILALIKSNAPFSEKQIEYIIKSNNENIILSLISSNIGLLEKHINLIISLENQKLITNFIHTKRNLKMSYSILNNILSVADVGNKVLLILSNQKFSEKQIEYLFYDQNKIIRKLYSQLIQDNSLYRIVKMNQLDSSLFSLLKEQLHLHMNKKHTISNLNKNKIITHFIEIINANILQTINKKIKVRKIFISNFIDNILAIIQKEKYSLTNPRDISIIKDFFNHSFKSYMSDLSSHYILNKIDDINNIYDNISLYHRKMLSKFSLYDIKKHNDFLISTSNKIKEILNSKLISSYDIERYFPDTSVYNKVAFLLPDAVWLKDNHTNYKCNIKVSLNQKNKTLQKDIVDRLLKDNNIFVRAAIAENPLILEEKYLDVLSKDKSYYVRVLLILSGKPLTYNHFLNTISDNNYYVIFALKIAQKNKNHTSSKEIEKVFNNNEYDLKHLPEYREFHDLIYRDTIYSFK